MSDSVRVTVRELRITPGGVSLAGYDTIRLVAGLSSPDSGFVSRAASWSVPTDLIEVDSAGLMPGRCVRFANVQARYPSSPPSKRESGGRGRAFVISRRASVWLAALLLTAGAAQFLVLGPRRAVTGSLDFAAPYAGAKAWVKGLNPYDPATLAGILSRSGREINAEPAFTPALYPAPTFVALLPLVPLSWPVARLVWLATSLTLLGFAIRALVKLAGVGGDRVGTLLVTGGTLALAPFGTGIALGQPAVASITLAVIAIERIAAGSRAGGAFLAVALLLKPQVAGPIALFYLLRGPGKPAAQAFGVYAVAALVGFGVVAASGTDWMSSWRANTAAELQGGAIDPRGPVSAQMVDPRPLLSAIFDVQAPFWPGAFIALLAAVTLIHFGRRLAREHDLLLVANVAVLSLFIGYHRFYDAALLCIPLAWAVSTACRSLHVRTLALAAVACIIPFLASGAWTLQRLGNEGRVPAAVVSSLLWDALVLRHQIWALLALQTVLLVAVWRRGDIGRATAIGSAQL